MSGRRLVDVAAAAGVSPVWLRGYLLLEIDRATRGTCRLRQRATSSCSRATRATSAGARRRCRRRGGRDERAAPRAPRREAPPG